MIYASFGTLAFGQLRLHDDKSVRDPLWRLQQIDDLQLRYLIELFPWSGEEKSEVTWLPGPIGALPYGELRGQTSGALRAIHLSDHHFITEPHDDPSSTYFSPLVDNPLSYDASIIRGDEVGVNTHTFGAISIANGDGELDYLMQMNWKGRRLIVKVGGEGFSYDDYAIVFDGLCNAIEADDGNILITISDKGLRLDKEIITPDFKGTGGLEGNEDLAGQMKPLLYGRCFNIEPVLVDANALIYQLHDGSTQQVEGVYDAGVALTFDADYPDIVSAVPPTGHYATCLSTGHIKLGSTPFGRITVDAQGCNDGGYVSQTGDVCIRMAQKLYDNESFDLDDIDTLGWNVLDQHIPGATGIFITERRTLRQLFDELLNPCAAYWFFTRSGLLSAAYVDAVNQSSTILSPDDLETSGIAVADIAPPSWRISVGYAPVWNTQNANELAGGTSTSRRTFVGMEYRFSSYENRNIRTANLQPLERTFYTNLADKAAADALLERLKRLYGQERRLYRLRLNNRMFRSAIGETIQLKYPRYQIDQPVTIMSVSEDAASSSTTLELWG